jgi:hypothetical protein
MEYMHAWVVEEENGEEGIVGAVIQAGALPGLGLIPLVYGGERSPAVLKGMRDAAMGHAHRTGLPVRLIRFSTREVVEEIESGRA